MIKVLTAIKRRPDFTVDAFQRHWLEHHASVVLELSGILRYHQSHVLEEAYGAAEPIYDGIAEVWFKDLDAMRALAGSPEHAALIEDEARFIDRASMATLLTTEHELKSKPRPAEAVKRFDLARRRPDLTVQEFQRYWREIHGPIAAQVPAFLHYVQCHPRPGGYGRGRDPTYDAVAVTWFASIADMRASETSIAFQRMRADESEFVAPEPRVALLTEEHVIVR